MIKTKQADYTKSCFDYLNSLKSRSKPQTECFDILKELEDNKPLRTGKVPSWAIIDDKSIIMSHLNQCILNSIFPDDSKIAIVTPIFQKSDVLDPKKYGPLSITASFLKICEKSLD